MDDESWHGTFHGYVPGMGTKTTDYVIIGGCNWDDLDEAILGAKAEDRLLSFVAPWPVSRIPKGRSPGDLVYIHAESHQIDWLVRPTLLLFDVVSRTPTRNRVFICKQPSGEFFLASGLSDEDEAVWEAIKPIHLLGCMEAAADTQLLYRLDRRSTMRQIDIAAVLDHWKDLDRFP